MFERASFLILLSGDATVDVLVVLSERKKGFWNLHDRLGRKVGKITQEALDRFVVHPNSDGPLASAIIKTSASLEEAMDKIAGETKGECQLSEPETRAGER